MKNHPEVSPATKTPAIRAVAYFRCSVQDGQKNSTAIQKNQVRQWAHDHDVEILHEFCDIGPSGTETQGRPAFTEMLEVWIKQRSDFEFALCFDASRLGRYSASDRAQNAIVAFEQYKKQLIFTSMGKQQTRSFKTA